MYIRSIEIKRRKGKNLFSLGRKKIQFSQINKNVSIRDTIIKIYN